MRRRGISIDPSLFHQNTTLIDDTVYSPVARARAPKPYIVELDNPKTVEVRVPVGAQTPEAFRGGLVAPGRGAALDASGAPTEIRPAGSCAEEHLHALKSTRQLQHKFEESRRMEKRAVRGIEEMATRYGIDPDTMQQSFVKGRGVAQDAEGVPVVTSDGRVVGRQALPGGATAPASEGGAEAFGFSVHRDEDPSPVPLVLAQNYPGLETYSCGVAGRAAADARAARADQNEANAHAANVQAAPGFWQQFREAWTTGGQSPMQVSMVVVTVLLGVALLLVVVWALMREPARREPARREPARQEPARQEPARQESAYDWFARRY